MQTSEAMCPFVSSGQHNINSIWYIRKFTKILYNFLRKPINATPTQIQAYTDTHSEDRTAVFHTQIEFWFDFIYICCS